MWLRPCLDFVISGYESLRLDRAEIVGRESVEADRTHGGCATFVKDGLQYRRVGIKGNLECIVVKVWDSQNHRGRANSSDNDNVDRNNTEGENGNSRVGSNNRKSVTVINFYNPCNRMTVSDFDDVMEKVRCLVIWAGDFNAHNPLWGSVQRDSNGVVVEDFLDKYGLVVINDGRPTRYNIARNTSSHLDLTIASPSLARVGEWKVMDTNNLGSDHYPILSNFGGDFRREERERGYLDITSLGPSGIGFRKRQ